LPKDTPFLQSEADICLAPNPQPSPVQDEPYSGWGEKVERGKEKNSRTLWKKMLSTLAQHCPAELSWVAETCSN
jgi:hypothetical protein